MAFRCKERRYVSTRSLRWISLMSCSNPSRLTHVGHDTPKERLMYCAHPFQSNFCGIVVVSLKDDHTTHLARSTVQPYSTILNHPQQRDEQVISLTPYHPRPTLPRSQHSSSTNTPRVLCLSGAPFMGPPVHHG